MDRLKHSFLHSEKLQRHIGFLYSKGGLYKCFNGNLLFHGCIPMDDKGEFLQFEFGGKTLSRQGADGLLRDRGARGLLRARGHGGAPIRQGFPVVSVVRAQLALVRARPYRHL